MLCRIIRVAQIGYTLARAAVAYTQTEDFARALVVVTEAIEAIAAGVQDTGVDAHSGTVVS